MNEFINIQEQIPGGIDSTLLAQRAKMFSGGKARIAPKISEQSQLPLAKKYEIETVARNFESLFIHMMYKQMKSSMLSDTDDQSMTFGKDTLEGFTDLAFADQMSKAGNGIGIAEKIYEFLTGERHLPSVITQSSNISQPEAYKHMPAPTVSGKKDVESLESLARRIGGLDERISGFEDIINEAADANGISSALIKSIIAAESSGITDAVSSAGAKGLMQLMDSTAAEMGVTDSFDPKENIHGGASYLKKMLDMFDGDLDLALAAYNAGPGNIDKFGGIPPFVETKAYLNKVRKYHSRFREIDKSINQKN